MVINVVLEKFEGPLDLLLQLVRRSEISVWEIRIQSICEQFVEYTRRLESLDVDAAGDFLVMAATLMRLKARLLLPRRPGQEEEPDQEPLDEEEQMIARLLAYEGFREAAALLEEMADESAEVFTRGLQEDLPSRDVGDPLDGISLLTLAIMVDQALREAEPTPALEVHAEEFTLVGQMARVRSISAGAPEGVTFRQLLSARPTRLEVVVTFLAILELVRRQEITVFQENVHTPLLVNRRDTCGKSVQAGGSA